MGSQMIQVIVLAGIALFLVLRLRNVLGTREGFEKPQEMSDGNKNGRSVKPFDVIEGGALDADVADFADPESDTGKALLAMKRIDHSFNVSEFTHGARQAYEMIVMAYENGDLETLEKFLAPEVFKPFEAAIEERNKEGYQVEADFKGVREVSVLGAHFDPRTSEGDVTMGFVGELTSMVREPGGEIVEGSADEIKQQKDVWTFTRDMSSDDPNWLLTGTGG